MRDIDLILTILWKDYYKLKDNLDISKITGGPCFFNQCTHIICKKKRNLKLYIGMLSLKFSEIKS